jgi:hypothetical protein
MEPWIDRQSGGRARIVDSFLASIREADALAAMVSSHSVIADLLQKYQNGKHASVFANLALSILQHPTALIVRPNLIPLDADFRPERDLLTVLVAIFPFLDTDVLDEKAVSAKGFHPPAIIELRGLLGKSGDCPVFLAASWLES